MIEANFFLNGALIAEVKENLVIQLRFQISPFLIGSSIRIVRLFIEQNAMQLEKFMLHSKQYEVQLSTP
jgi:hypothetical protein